MESRSITPQGGEAADLPFGRTRGYNPHVRYNLIVKFFVNLVYYVVNPVPRIYVSGFGVLPLQGDRNIHPRAYARGVLWYGVNKYYYMSLKPMV